MPRNDLVEATDNFDENNLLKRGERADVYKGVLRRWLGADVEEDVVIRKYRRHHQFNFYEELHKIYVFQYRDFVSFYGFCDEDGERIIVLESAVNGSLSRYLSDPAFTWFYKLYVCCYAVDELIHWKMEAKIRDHVDYGVTGYRPKIESFKIYLSEDWRPKILICTSALYDVKEYSSMYCLGEIMLGVLYGRKVTIEDVNQYLEYNYEERKHVGNTTQIEPKSLSIFKKIIYMCLKGSFDLNYHKNKLLKACWCQMRLELSSLLQLWMGMKLSLSDIITATNGFSKNHHVTSHPSDELYKGKLGTSDGEKWVFIKRYNKINIICFFMCMYMMAISEFPDLLVSLLGFCVEDRERILVFELESRDDLKCLDAFSSLETMSSFNASVFQLPDIPLEDIVTTNIDEAKLFKLGGMPDIHERVCLRCCYYKKVMGYAVIWKYTGFMYVTYDSFPLFWHRNVVNLYGCFYEGGETMIVMEYPANGSLDDYLSDPIALTWCQRLSISYGTACVLDVWNCKIRILNQYYKLKYPIVESMKIFLDKDWEAKVLICTEKHPWNGNGNYSFDEYGLGIMLLELLYGRKITTEDVIQYINAYEREEHVVDMIDPNLRKQMPQTYPQSLSIFLKTAYKPLKRECDLQPRDIQQSLKDAYDVDQYIDSYEKEKRVADMIDPDLRKQMPQMNPRSLYIILETTYKCLKRECDLQAGEIQQSLKDAYENQCEHIDSMF